MRKHTNGSQMMVKEANKTNNFWGRFVYNIVLY